jgi:c-di-GMP-binding flagellar brake protein YcgR
MQVRLMLGDKEIKATSTNISEGGMALLLHQALPKSGTPRLQFALPETRTALEVETEIAWADIKGHVGLRFLNVPQSSQEALEKWLSQQMEGQISGSKGKPAGPGSAAVQ